MGWSLTKEAKVKGAFVEHLRVDTPEKNISQVKVSDESKPVKAPNL